MAPSGKDTKILRIGVIQGGKVIEERLVRKKADVCVGSDHKNTFVLAGADVPKSWLLFELKGAKYDLLFSEDMKGRVSVDKNDVDFSSLKAQNFAQKSGDRYRLSLNDTSRGRVQLGNDLTILFHFVAAPPEATRPEMPSAAKGGWVKSIEKTFTACLSASFAVHAMMTLLVFNVEPPPPPSKEDVLRAIAKLQPPKIEKPKPKADKSDKKKKKGDKKSEAKKAKAPEPEKAPAEKPVQKPSTADEARKAQARRAEVRKAVSNKGLLAMIGASNSDSDASVGNVFGSGSAIGGDLQNALAGTSGVGVASSGGDITRRGGGGGGGGAADIGAVSAGGGGQVATARKGPAQIKSRVTADDISGVDGQIDKKIVAKTIRRRQRAFQQCYENALKSNSKLAGKLVVEFVIGEDGRVKDADVVRDGVGSSDVSKCVLKLVKRLRFPKPDEGEVTITNSFVFQPGG